MTSVIAEDPPKPGTKRALSKTDTQIQVSTTNTVVTALEEELETLEAQRQIKKGYYKLAEMDVTEAEQVVENATRNVEIASVKQDLETARTQLEIKTGELKEVEVKIKQARRRLAQAKECAELKSRGKELKVCGEVMGMVGFGGISLLSGINEIQPPIAHSTSGTKIAVFNMALVMRNYEKAKSEVFQLTEEKKKLSVDLLEMRGEYIKLEQEIRGEQNPAKREELAERQRTLTRKIQDSDNKINKQLNEKSSIIISQLYDEVMFVTEKLMEKKGYDIIFSYPDATTPEEAKNAYIKELKLKPPAAQPFVLTKQIDVTEEIVKELNSHFTPKQVTGKRVIE